MANCHDNVLQSRISKRNQSEDSNNDDESIPIVNLSNDLSQRRGQSALFKAERN